MKSFLHPVCLINNTPPIDDERNAKDNFRYIISHFTLQGCPSYHNLSADKCEISLRQKAELQLNHWLATKAADFQPVALGRLLFR